MRYAAPAVEYLVRRDRRLAGVLAALWLAGAAAAAAAAGTWQAGHAPAGWREALLAAAVLTAGAGAGWAWHRMPEGRLAWDGQGWTWDGGKGPQPVPVPQVCIDLPGALLLDLPPHGRCWLLRASSAWRWADLRRAVLAHAGPASRASTDAAGAPA